jgi:hypothetical protein
MIQKIYEFIVMLDDTGFAYLIFFLCFLIMANYAFKAQEEVVRLRKILKQVAR